MFHEQDGSTNNAKQDMAKLEAQLASMESTVDKVSLFIDLRKIVILFGLIKKSIHKSLEHDL